MLDCLAQGRKWASALPVTLPIVVDAYNPSLIQQAFRGGNLGAAKTLIGSTAQASTAGIAGYASERVGADLGAAATVDRDKCGRDAEVWPLVQACRGTDAELGRGVMGASN